MGKNVIEIYCESCGGTGLYQGLGEADGCAVICRCCNGTGKDDFHYTPFNGKRKKKGVRRVFESSFGFGHSADNFTDKNGKVTKFEEGGCTYKEWLNGASPKPVKDLYCPYLYNRQNVSKTLKKKCDSGLGCGSPSICSCKHFSNKEECWKLFEKKS